MRRDQLGDLMVFMVVAEECSFTRAAARLETSQSTLSHTIRRLESRRQHSPAFALLIEQLRYRSNQARD